jgi:cobalamin synthase
VELCVLAAFIIAGIGLARGDSSGRIMLACGIALGSLAGLELSIREHFAGYKPHSVVLAATLAVALLAVLFFVRAPQFVLPPAAAAVFGIAFWLFRGVFKRRSGGLGYR